jgi:hypothetical protein
VGVRQLLDQSESFMDSPQGLIWVAQRPQDAARIAEANYPRVLSSIQKGEGAVLLGIIEGYALLYVRSGWGKLS